MKSFSALSVSLFLSLVSATSIAQIGSGVSVTKAPVESITKSKGVTVGLVYSNLSDVTYKSKGTQTLKGSTTDTDDTSTSGTHV